MRCTKRHLIAMLRAMSLSVYSTNPDSLSRRGKVFHWVGLLSLVCLSLVLAWRYTGVPPEQALVALEQAIRTLTLSPLGPLYLMIIQGLSGLLLLPYTPLALLTGYLYDPLSALLINFFGCAANASLLFWVGRWLGPQTLLRDNSTLVQRLRRRVARRGLLTVVVLRNLPIAPFAVVNLLCGAMHIRFRDYLLGTQLGSGPVLIALTLFGDQLQRTLHNPGLTTLSWLLGSALLVIGVALAVEHWAETRNDYGEDDEPRSRR